MPKPQLSKKFLNQLYDMNILDPDQDPMEQFQQMQDIQRHYDSGKGPMESITDPDLKKPQATATPSSSTHSKHSTQNPVQTLFTDRARKLETDKKGREATEKAQRKAKALAKKEATSLQQGAAMSKQAKYAAEEGERLKEEKMAKERVQKQIEVDKVERREREELRKEAVRAGFDSHGSRTSKPLVLPQSSRGHSSGTKSIGSRRRDQSNIFVDRAPSPPSSSRSRPAYSANNDLDQDATNGDYAAGELADEPSTSEDYVPHGRNRDSAGRSRPQISLPTRTSLSRSGNRKPGRPTSDDDDDDESRYCMTCVKARFGLKKAIYVGNGQWRCSGPCGGSGAMVDATETSVPGWDWAEQETRDRMKRRFHSSLLMRGEVDAAHDRSPSSVTRGDSVSSMGTRLGGPRGPPASSYSQFRSSPTTRPAHSSRPTLSNPPRAGASSSSRPSPHRRTNTIERFDEHECAKKNPIFSSGMANDCPHPPSLSRNCSHCDRGVTTVCMPCVVRGCGGQWCDDCWDQMVARKRAAGASVTRPEGWQVCQYRSRNPDRRSWGRR